VINENTEALLLNNQNLSQAFSLIIIKDSVFLKMIINYTA